MRLDEQLAMAKNVKNKVTLIVLNNVGEIISYNEGARTIFPEIYVGSEFVNLFNDVNKEYLSNLISDFKKIKKEREGEIRLKVNNKEKTYRLLISSSDHNKENIYISLRPLSSANKSEVYARFNTRTSDLDKILSPEQNKIIDFINNNYPFTFINKNNFQSEINKLDEIFWLKDTDGNYVNVNSKYAEKLGLKVSQVEGKNEKEFIPNYLNDLKRSMENFLFETGKPIIVEGIYDTFLIEEQKEIIEFPLCDIENKTVAIIGFSSKIKNAVIQKEKNVNKLKEFSSKLSVPVISISEDNYAELLNIEAKRLFNIADNNTLLRELFSENLIQKIDEFKESKNKEKSIKINNFRNTGADIKCKFIKANDYGYDDSSLLVIFEKNELKDNKIGFKAAMYETIMKYSPEPIIIYDLENLKFLEVNDAAKKLYGYSKNEFLQLDLTDLYAPEDIQTLIQSKNLSSNTGEYTGPWKHKKKNGEIVLVEISKFDMEFQGRSAHINLIRDVSNKLEEDKLKQILSAAFENSSDPIFNTDADGFINTFNKAAESKLKISKKKLVDKPIISLFQDKYRSKITTEILHSDNTNPKELDVEIKSNDNKSVNAKLVATPIMNYQNELEAYNFILRVENVKEVIKEKVKTVEKPTNVLSEKQISDLSDSVDKNFLANVFHEILTPINVIIGFVHEIYESIGSPSEDQQEAMDIITDNQKVMIKIMDSVMEYVDLLEVDPDMEREKIKIVDILDELEESIKKDFVSKDKELKYGKISSTIELEANSNKFISLIANFMNIAAEMTENDSVYLTAKPYDEKYFSIGVKDNKKDISQKLLSGLNDVFENDEEQIRRNFGISRLSVRLFKSLFNLHGCKLDKVNEESDIKEFSLLVPVEYAPEKDKTKTDTAKEVSAKPLEDEEAKPIKKEITEPKKEIVEETEPVQSETKQKIRSGVVEEDFENEKIEEELVINEDADEQWTKDKISSMRCLYLEDQVDSQILFKVQMKDLKSVDCSDSLENALPLLKSKKYDFIVMDINLKGEYNGLDALRIIQKMPGYENIPVIASTAYILPGDRERFVKAGFSDFISKPVMRDRIIEVLQNIFD